MESDQKFVAYFRVSTDRQGRSGLGLDAQRLHVKNYVASSNGNLLEEFVEVESGRKADRPQLAAAIAKCKKNNAILLIAKLDRLARRVHFISGLMETGVQFRAADMPNADKFMLHVYAAMAEEEARRISERTKHALQSAKARGIKLGVTGRALAERHKAAAQEFAISVGPTIAALKADGLSVRKIADRLNFDNVKSHSGGAWHPTAVQRVWSRFEKLPTTGKISNPLCQYHPAPEPASFRP
jgi:DNA invertase Pin-like site-specific DNA recombinase